MFDSPSQQTSHHHGIEWVYISELESMARWLCEGDEASPALRSATRSMDTFRGPEMVRRWLHTLTTCEFENQAGERTHSDLIDRFVEAKRVRIPADKGLEREIQVRLGILEQLCALPDNYRCALLLKEGHGLSVERTASIMAVSPASIRSILYRARRVLRGSISRDGA